MACSTRWSIAAVRFMATWTNPPASTRLMMGSFSVVADLSAYTRANPVASIPPDNDPDAGGFSMVVDDANSTIWLTNPNSSQVLTVTADGTITRVADLSEGHPVLTGIALDPNGGVFVATLTAVPFPDGPAPVIHVSEDGSHEDDWTGLTAVTGLAVGSDGTLYAAEMSTGNLAEPSFLQPFTGRIVRQTGPDTMEGVAAGLFFLVAIGFGPDDGLYVAIPAVSSNDGCGSIIRLDTGMGTPSPMAGEATIPECAPLAQTLQPAGATPVASPVASPSAWRPRGQALSRSARERHAPCRCGKADQTGTTPRRSMMVRARMRAPTAIWSRSTYSCGSWAKPPAGPNSTMVLIAPWLTMMVASVPPGAVSIQGAKPETVSPCRTIAPISGSLRPSSGLSAMAQGGPPEMTSIERSLGVTPVN